MRRRYIQDKETGKLVEISQGSRSSQRKTAYVRGDIEPFVSHVDGSVIGSRSSLREHNNRNGVIQTSEYGEGNFCEPAAKKAREQKILGTHAETNKERRNDVIAAYKENTGDL